MYNAPGKNVFFSFNNIINIITVYITFLMYIII